MAVKRIDHIAVVVDDIDASLAFWRHALGMDMTHLEEVQEQESIVAFLPTGGSEVELVKPTIETSGVAKYLAKRGPGMHHICLEVDNLEEMLAGMKVIIETTGSLIQGVWGNGKINYGLLNILAHAPDEMLTPDRMDISLRAAVVMAGYCEDEKVLRSAEELPIRGMILASMDSALVPVALSVNYPIILIEGFGKLPMNQEAYLILSSSGRREVSLNAEPWDRIGNTRPEVVISAEEGTYPEVPSDLVNFSVGQTVRVVTPPYKSILGKLTSLPQGIVRLPSGLLAAAAEGSLLNGDTVQVPLANLEIIG